MNRDHAKSRLLKTDAVLYGTSIILSALAVLMNYHMAAADQASERMLAASPAVEKILSRMDMMSGQLGAWGTMDVQQYRR